MRPAWGAEQEPPAEPRWYAIVPLYGQPNECRGFMGSGSIETLEALFFAELQELRSAELQLAAELVGTAALLKNASLRTLLQGYAAELNSRREEIERLLGAAGIDAREHSDQAMKSLLDELLKMAQLPVPQVRDAAFIDSLQRIVHFKIAAYGSVATFARMLGRTGDASRFAAYANREKAADAQLTAIATGDANPQSVGRAPPDLTRSLRRLY
jgi:ferritin-like metal-binding protein YciE